VSVSFSIDTRTGLVCYAVEGAAALPEAGGFLVELLTHRDFQRGFHLLGDRRGVRVAPTAAEIQAVAARVRSHAESLAPCKWAVVVASEEEFGAVRTWALLVRRAGVEVAPFTSATRARAWLAGRA
jgi:hypothetical protein